MLDVVSAELVLLVEVVDRMFVVVDDIISVVFKRCGVIEENCSSTRYKVDSWLFMLDVEVVDSTLVIGGGVGVVVDSTVFKRCGVIEENSS